MSEINVILSKHDMRKQITKALSTMQQLRKEVLIEGKINGGRLEKYYEAVFCASSFLSALESERKIIEPHKDKIFEHYNQDEALAKYDPLQDRWWLSTAAGSSFIKMLRLLSAYYLRGSLNNADDTFHVLQMLKCIYESDQEVRAGNSFIQPAYGGVALPYEYRSPLLVSLTGNRHIKELESPGANNALTLFLDWYPPDDQKGIEEVKKVMEIAATLDYMAVEFKLPEQLKYEGLHKHFGASLQAKQTERGWVGVIQCDLLYRECHADSILQALENEDAMLDILPPGEFDVDRRMLHTNKNSVKSALAVDSVGFATRLLFTSEKEDGIAHCGVYFFENEADRSENEAGKKVDLTMEKGMLRTAAGILEQHMPEVDTDSTGKVLDNICNLIGSPLRAMVMYATVKNLTTGAETELEGIEHEEGQPREEGSH